MAAQLHEAKYISSKRGMPILIYQNSHEYWLKSEMGESKYWDCRRSDSAKCSARAITVIQVIYFIAYICKNIIWMSFKEGQDIIKKLQREHNHSSLLLHQRVKQLEDEVVNNAAVTQLCQLDK